jgi:hypothetical protein
MASLVAMVSFVNDMNDDIRCGVFPLLFLWLKVKRFKKKKKKKDTWLLESTSLSFL